MKNYEMMTHLELSHIYLQLEHEINSLSQSAMSVYRSPIKKDAQHVIADFREDIDDWMIKLTERRIPCSMLESLLLAKKEEMQLENLKQCGVPAADLDDIKNEILRLIAKSLLSTYLNSLFRNQSSVQHSKWKQKESIEFF